jgi:hypothetical protein
VLVVRRLGYASDQASVAFWLIFYLC